MKLPKMLFVAFIYIMSALTPAQSDTISAREKELIQKHILSIKPGQLTPLDLSNPDVEAAYRAYLRRSGLNATKNSAYLNLVDALKKKHVDNKKRAISPGNLMQAHLDVSASTPADDFMILGVQGTSWRDLKAYALSTLYAPEGSHDSTMMGNMTLYSADDTPLSAATLNGATDTPTAIIATDQILNGTNTSNPAEKDVYVYATFLGIKGGVVYGPYSIRTPVITRASLPNTTQWLAPVNIQTKAGTPAIICLNRSHPEPDAPDVCDYGPVLPEGQSHDLSLWIPMKGGVLFPNPIKVDANNIPVDPQGTTSQIQITLLGRTTGGSCQARLGKDSEIWKKISLSADKKSLSWNFAPASNDQQNLNNYVNFGPLCWPSNTDYNLTLNMNITTIDPSTNLPTSTLVAFTNAIPGAPGQPTVGITKIPDIQIQFGCLLEGTLITMADGSERPIEALRKGDMVARRGGGELRVRGRTVGTDIEFVTLADDLGHKIVMTPTHPVPTQRGMLKARDVKRGDIIATRKGDTIIANASIETAQKNSKVYNISLEAADGTELRHSSDRTFYANSILVGDNITQGELSRHNISSAK